MPQETKNKEVDLKYHRKTKHGNGEGFKCKQCEKKCLVNSELELHMMIHTREMPRARIPG